MPPPRNTWKALLLGGLLFVAMDTLVFRSWLYGWLAKPDSSLGWVARRTLHEAWAKPARGQPSVLLLGDSTMAEGCSPERLQAALGGAATQVVDGSVPATPLRVWPYLFERLPPPPGGFTVVVAGLSSYDDDAYPEDLQRRTQDLAFLGPLLGWAEAPTIAASFADEPQAWRDTWVAAYCKAYAWRRDLRDLFADPWARYREVRRQLGRLQWGEPYQGHEGSLAGARVVGDRLVDVPSDDPQTLAQLRQAVWPAPGVDNHAYRQQWLGALADRVVATGAELVLVRMPLQVLPPAVPKAPDRRAVTALAQRPHVHVLPAERFAELERPEFFWDGLHLNRAGRERFTALLAAVLRERFPTRFGS